MCSLVPLRVATLLLVAAGAMRYAETQAAEEDFDVSGFDHVATASIGAPDSHAKGEGQSVVKLAGSVAGKEAGAAAPPTAVAAALPSGTGSTRAPSRKKSAGAAASGAASAPKAPAAAAPPAATAPLEGSVKAHKTENRVSIKDVTSTMLSVMNAMMQETFLGHWSFDRVSKGDELPSGFKVVKVEEISNPLLEKRFNDYKAELQNMFTAKGIKADDCKFKRGPSPRTMKVAELVKSLDKDPCLNEVYLLHGTEPLGIVGISKYGHDMARAGIKQGMMLGPGIYLSDSSVKADEYTKAEPVKGLDLSARQILVERVFLGRPWVIICDKKHRKEANKKTAKVRKVRSNLTAMESFLHHEGRQSILRDAEHKIPRPTFKEFAMFRSEAVLPQYIVYYQRKPGQATPPQSA